MQSYILPFVLVVTSQLALASQPTIDDFVESSELRSKYRNQCSVIDPLSLAENDVCYAYHKAADKRMSNAKVPSLSGITIESPFKKNPSNIFDSSRRSISEDISSLVERLCGLSGVKYVYLNGQRIMPDLYRAAREGESAYNKLKDTLTCENFDVVLIEKNKKMWGG